MLREDFFSFLFAFGITVPGIYYYPYPIYIHYLYYPHWPILIIPSSVFHSHLQISVSSMLRAEAGQRIGRRLVLALLHCVSASPLLENNNPLKED